MKPHFDHTNHSKRNRSWEIGIAVFAFLVSCGLGALIFYILMTLSELSQQ